MAAIFFRRANVFGVRAVSTARTLLDSASEWPFFNEFLVFVLILFYISLDIV